jgi:hypothetical protein
MAPVQPLDARRASPSPLGQANHQDRADDLFSLDDFDEEIKRLSAANQQLLETLHTQDDDALLGTDQQHTDALLSAVGLTPASPEQLEMLRLENAELRNRVEALEALGNGKAELTWLERQREYEMLLEEKSEVIRGLHQKIQEAQESAIGGDTPPAPGGSAVGSAMGSALRLGQAEEILRLKREMEEQRRQLEQDEEALMGQMRQMELTMARERAEMARQRQEMQRLQAEMSREIEQSGRDPELRERLNSLRRTQDAKPAPAAAAPTPTAAEKSSGFFRRIFG